MSSSPSSTSSNDEDYFSASEYISPAKPANDTGGDGEDAEFYTPSKESGGGEDSSSACPLTASLQRLHEASRAATEFANRYAAVDPPRDAEADDPQHAHNPWTDMPSIAQGLDQRRSALSQAWRDAKTALDTHPSGGEEEDDTDDDDSDDEQEDDDDDDDEQENDKNDKRVLDEELYNIDFTLPVDLHMEATIDAGAVAETGSNDGEEKQPETEDSNDRMPEDDFREVYMAMMTETFGDALEELQGGNNGDGNGNDVDVDVDVDVLVECLQSGMELLEPHERHRKSFFDSLGYDGNGDEDMEHKADDKVGDEEKELAVHQLRQRRLGYLIPPQADE